MSEKESKTISIRGVEAEIYDQFAERVKNADINMGEAITAMMNGVLSDFDEVFEDLSKMSANYLSKLARLKKSTIQHQNYLEVTKGDLEEANERFVFQHIENLIFMPDVDNETYEKYVHVVQHCRYVQLKKGTFPKLKAYSQIMHCRDILFYDEKPDFDILEREQEERRKRRRARYDSHDPRHVERVHPVEPIPPEPPEAPEPPEPPFGFEDDEEY